MRYNYRIEIYFNEGLSSGVILNSPPLSSEFLIGERFMVAVTKSNTVSRPSLKTDATWNCIYTLLKLEQGGQRPHLSFSLSQQAELRTGAMTARTVVSQRIMTPRLIK